MKIIVSRYEEPFAFTAVVLLILSITAITTIEINPIEGVQGEIFITRFDSSSNLYVVSSEPSLRVYKLDSEKNVVWKEWIYDPVEDLHVTSQGHVYLIQSIGSTGNFRSNITLFPAGTKNFIQLDLTRVDGAHLLEGEAYLFYDGSDSSVKLLKRGEKLQFHCGFVISTIDRLVLLQDLRKSCLLLPL